MDQRTRRYGREAGHLGPPLAFSLVHMVAGYFKSAECFIGEQRVRSQVVAQERRRPHAVNPAAISECGRSPSCRWSSLTVCASLSDHRVLHSNGTLTSAGIVPDFWMSESISCSV